MLYNFHDYFHHYFYSQKDTRGPQNSIFPRIKAYFSVADTRLARWSDDRAVIYKMATASLSNCVSDTAKKTLIFN